MYIQRDMQHDVLGEEEEYNLLSILDESRICIFPDRCSWQNSVRIAGRCLLDNRSIEPKYLDTMITQLQYYGPYMFLTENVLLAHAKPEDGVNCLDVSMALFRESVWFSDSKKAKIIWVLAAEDQEKHLKILQDILTLTGDSKFLSDIENAKSSTDILVQIKSVLSEKS